MNRFKCRITISLLSSTCHAMMTDDLCDVGIELTGGISEYCNN
jgi:hypothetical protein